jgi:hypothetical protein
MQFKSGNFMETMDLKKTKISGKMELHFIQKQTFDIGDVEGHIVSLRKAEGKNVNTGKADFMNGARMINVSFDDLVKGNGPHHGYSTLINNGNLVITKWDGEIITTLSVDGTPITSFSGRLWWIKATGIFENMHGEGTYQGWFTSETSFVVDWEGEYYLKE